MVVLKKVLMMLYSGVSDLSSHTVRFVLAEKGVSVDIVYIDPEDLPEDLISINPYHSAPTLIDRELVLYEPNVICEYLDERFPYPPLLPVYPIARAKCRLMIYRIDRDLLSLVPVIQDGKKSKAAEARKSLQNHLVALAPIFKEMKYFLSDDLTLVDCFIAPMLWRLKILEVELPSQAKSVVEYSKRLFEKDSFQGSLSEVEREFELG